MRPKEHYATLLNLSQQGRPLDSNAPGATVRNPKWFRTSSAGDPIPTAARRQLHTSITSAFWRRNGSVDFAHQAIILAGPPGAGKSTTLHAAMADAHLRDGQFATIEADAFKVDLLQAAIDDHSFDTDIAPREVKSFEDEGQVFFPLDFAGLVHKESVMIARSVVAQGLAVGANVVVDGTLSSLGDARVLFTELAEAAYSVRLIVDVEASRAVAEGRAFRRWLSDYERTYEQWKSSGTYIGLGGRLVPPSAYDWMFSGPDGLSLPLITAKAIEREFSDDVRLMVYFSSEDSAFPALEYDSAAGGGIVRIGANGEQFAACTVCHRPLSAPASIRAGVGPRCATMVQVTR